MMVSQCQFGIGLVNIVLNLPDWASEHFWGFKIGEVSFFFTFQHEYRG